MVRRIEDQDVIDAVGRLKPVDQEVLYLAVWEELSHDAIGAILGCSAHAVDQRIPRAAKRLASELRRAGHIHHQTATPDRIPRGEAP